MLSDPLRRREWDARHRPGPVRADTSSRTPAPTAPARPRGQPRRRRPVTGTRPRPDRVRRAGRAPRRTGSGAGPTRSPRPVGSPRATRTLVGAGRALVVERPGSIAAGAGAGCGGHERCRCRHHRLVDPGHHHAERRRDPSPGPVGRRLRRLQPILWRRLVDGLAGVLPPRRVGRAARRGRAIRPALDDPAGHPSRGPGPSPTAARAAAAASRAAAAAVPPRGRSSSRVLTTPCERVFARALERPGGGRPGARRGVRVRSRVHVGTAGRAGAGLAVGRWPPRSTPCSAGWRRRPC